MDKPIEPFDLYRMLFGEAPPEFAIEVFFRSLILFLYMLVVMRLFGKRMTGELSATEMVIIVTLGGAISVPMQVPEEGFLVGFVVLTCFVLFERGITWLTTRSRRFELLVQGDTRLLVKDGEFQITEMKKIKITKEQICSVLRQQHIEHLSEVERLYIEAGSGFSLYKKEAAQMREVSLFPLSKK
jgi:uncharacterized membrane protein YcaP (DUF421 family)